MEVEEKVRPDGADNDCERLRRKLHLTANSLIITMQHSRANALGRKEERVVQKSGQLIQGGKDRQRRVGGVHIAFVHCGRTSLREVAEYVVCILDGDGDKHPAESVPGQRGPR